MRYGLARATEPTVKEGTRATACKFDMNDGETSKEAAGRTESVRKNV